MGFSTEVFPSGEYASRVAERIAGALPRSGSVVLTGGTTAEKIYPFLALQGADWKSLSVAFSDERCVPPDDPASNYKMAHDLLLRDVHPANVHRMPGEQEPTAGAAAYDGAIAPLVADGFDLLLLGMGADAHVGALYPDSPALSEKTLCAAVDRPDGVKGLTLTPPAMLSAKKVLLLVTGAAKAGTVSRALAGTVPVDACPVLLLKDHPHVTFLLDEDSAPVT